MEKLPTINEDRQWLLRQLPKESVGAEVGVFVGNFSHDILLTVKPVELNLIDIWKWHPTKRINWRSKQLKMACQLRFAKYIKRGEVILHHMESMRACKSFADNSLDWVYIDAGHTFELAYEDLSHWAAKVKPGGIIFGDDYDLSGVNKAFTQWRKETKREWEWLYLTSCGIRFFSFIPYIWVKLCNLSTHGNSKRKDLPVGRLLILDGYMMMCQSNMRRRPTGRSFLLLLPWVERLQSLTHIYGMNEKNLIPQEVTSTSMQSLVIRCQFRHLPL